MKHSFYLLAFAVILVSCGHARAAPSAAVYDVHHDSLKPLTRVARQMPPPPEGMPTPPPPPEGMPPMQIERFKREAKGGGSMPTRKG